MKFVPAILTDTVSDLRNQLNRLTPYFDYYSIDIEDSTFTESSTFQIQELIDSRTIWINESIKKCTFDFDLMTENWEGVLPQLETLTDDIKIRNVFLHVQTLKKGTYPIVRHFPFSIGLALDVKDEVKDLAHNIDLNFLSAIQIMTVQSGLQSQSMITEMLNKVSELRDSLYRSKIYIDGGVNEDTMKTILMLKYLPDYVCVGSYLSHAGDNLQKHINYLKSIELESSTEKEV